jgi:hypothetical protein
MIYRLDGRFYDCSMKKDNHWFSSTAEYALDVSLEEMRGNRILVNTNPAYNNFNFYELEKQGLNILANCFSKNYYSLKDVVHLARKVFLKGPCFVCGKIIRPGWFNGSPDSACFSYQNHWTEEQSESHRLYREGLLPVVYNKGRYVYREQKYQNAYCRVRGIPIKTQRHPGIDYYDESVGWLEFVRDGQLDKKDYVLYPTLAGDDPYTIVFVGRVPASHKIAELISRNISFEISSVQV